MQHQWSLKSKNIKEQHKQHLFKDKCHALYLEDFGQGLVALQLPDQRILRRIWGGHLWPHREASNQLLPWRHRIWIQWRKTLKFLSQSHRESFLVILAFIYPFNPFKLGSTALFRCPFGFHSLIILWRKPTILHPQGPPEALEQPLAPASGSSAAAFQVAVETRCRSVWFECVPCKAWEDIVLHSLKQQKDAKSAMLLKIIFCKLSPGASELMSEPVPNWNF